MIVPMKFVTLVILRDDREQVLRALQKQGNLMLCEPQDATRANAQAGAALRRMEKLIADIKPYASTLRRNICGNSFTLSFGEQIIHTNIGAFR